MKTRRLARKTLDGGVCKRLSGIVRIQGNVTIFKVVKNFSCWTVVVSVVLTVCKIAHKHSLGYYGYVFLGLIPFAPTLFLSRSLILCISVTLTELSNLAKCVSGGRGLKNNNKNKTKKNRGKL